MIALYRASWVDVNELIDFWPPPPPPPPPHPACREQIPILIPSGCPSDLRHKAGQVVHELRFGAHLDLTPQSDQAAPLSATRLSFIRAMSSTRSPSGSSTTDT